MRNSFLVATALAATLLTTGADAALKVFACEPEWAALTQELGGKDVEVYAATTALQDPHQVQARPSLLARFRSADLAVCTGAELELGWFPVLIQSGGNPRIYPGKPGLFEASQQVQMIEVPTTLDRAQGDIHPFGNPHIQTDPRNIGRIAPALAQRMAELDPAQAEAYQARAADFTRRWTAAIARWETQAKPLQGIPVISQHRSWIYMYEWLGIKEVAALEPKPGLPPSAAHLQELLEGIKRKPASMIVYAAYQDSKAAEFFSSRSGLPKVELPFTVGADGADDLFTLYQVTIDRLLAAMQTGRP